MCSTHTQNLLVLGPLVCFVQLHQQDLELRI